MLWLNCAEAPDKLLSCESDVADTIRKKIARQLAVAFRGTPNASEVRGAGIAVARLLELFFQGAPEQAWTVNVPPNLLDRVQLWAQAYKLPLGSSLRGAALPRQPETLSVEGSPKLWCDLTSTTVSRSLALRGMITSSNYPIVAINHTLSVPSLLQGMLTPLLLHQSFPYDRMICPTIESARSLEHLIHYQSEKLKEFGLKKALYEGGIRVIPVPTNTETFTVGEQSRARRELGITRDTFVLLYFGYVGVSKADLAAYLDALQRIIGRHRKRRILWLIAGTADASGLLFLRRQVQGRGLNGNVRIHADVSGADKLLFYQSADVFVSPSDTVQESFGMTVVEAMACGIPQVVSDWSGYREIVVQGETGFRVRTLWANCTSEFKMPFDLETWGRDHIGLGQSVCVDLGEWEYYIETLLVNQSLRYEMGQASRQRAVMVYANDVVLRKHLETWEEARSECDQHAGVRECKSGLDAPDYYRCFHNYASTNLEAGSMLRVANGHKGHALRTVEEYRALPGLDSLLNARIVDAILRNMGTQLVSLEEVSMLAARCAKVDVGIVQRHVMWLLKHGFIEYVQLSHDVIV